MRVTQSIRVSGGQIEKVWKDFRFDYYTWPICYAFSSTGQVLTLNIRDMKIQRRIECTDAEHIRANTAVYCKETSTYLTGTDDGRLLSFSHY